MIDDFRHLLFAPVTFFPMVLALDSGKKSRKGVSRRRKKEVPKTPQQILWEDFSLWLKTYRVKVLLFFVIVVISIVIGVSPPIETCCTI